MSTRTVIVAAAIGLVLAGCAHRQMTPPDSVKAARCNTSGSGARCNIVITADANGPYACALGRFRVEPDLLELNGGQPIMIHWHLQNPLAFCRGDGITLKAPWVAARRQVFENFGSDTEDGARSGSKDDQPCKRSWNWHWANTNPGTYYAYEIRFHDRRTMQSCTIDPWMRNG